MPYDIKQWKSRKKTGRASFAVQVSGTNRMFHTKDEAQRYVDLLEIEASGDMSDAWGWSVEKLCQEFMLFIDKKHRDDLVSNSWHNEKLRYTKIFQSLFVNNQPVVDFLARDLTNGNFELQLLPQLAETRSKKTCENILGAWIALFDFAKSCGCRKTNPCRGQKLNNIARNKTKYKAEKIQPTVIGEILNAMNDKWRLMTFFALATGLRQGEQRALTWGDILWDENKVQVTKAVKACQRVILEPKTSKGRRNVDLSPDLKKELQQLYLASGRPSRDTLIWSTNGKRMNRKSYTRNLAKAIAKANVDPIRWHDFRHFFASNMLQEEELWTVSNMLGHESIDTTTRIYGHWIEDEKDQAERLARMQSKFARFALN